MGKYKLMPEEATPEMLAAGEYALEAGCYVSGIYADMRAAAPSVKSEPVGWQFYQHGKWWNGDDRIKDHKKNTQEAGFRVRDVYAVPDVQKEPVDGVRVDLGTGGMMAICAFRYCCGRRTYVVSEFVEWAMRNWSSIDEKARKIIQRDLSEEIARDNEARKNRDIGAWLPLGDDCDRKEWVSLMEFIEKQEQNNV